MRAINILAGGMRLQASLNDTTAAEEFSRRLPCRLHGADAGSRYLCRIARGIFDPLQLQSSAEAGDLCLGDGWFSICYDAQPQKPAGYMVVGRIGPDALLQLRRLPEKAELIIETAEEKEKENENNK